jgi:hypothetical protein
MPRLMGNDLTSKEGDQRLHRPLPPPARHLDWLPHPPKLPRPDDPTQKLRTYKPWRPNRQRAGVQATMAP